MKNSEISHENGIASFHYRRSGSIYLSDTTSDKKSYLSWFLYLVDICITVTFNYILDLFNCNVEKHL